MAAGRYLELTDIIYPLFKKYADKCGADFFSIEDIQNPSCPVLDKFRVVEKFDEYDRMLFIDADILVRNDAPNLFDLVPVGQVGCYDEGSTIETQGLQIRMHHVNVLVNQWKLDSIEWPKVLNPGEILPYYNAGVVMMDAEHEYLFRKPSVNPLTKPTVPCGEQVYMNWGIRRFRPKMYHLPLPFNQMPYNRFRDYLYTSYFCHYAGYESFDERAKDMRREHGIWKSLGYI